MSKLTTENKFIDFSDYGRPFARIIAWQLKDTRVTSIHLTFLFGLSGLFAVVCILLEYYWAAGFFLIMKSILDAADGQLARVKGQPSYVGRYFDSILDSLLNMAFLLTIVYVTGIGIAWGILAFFCMQTQGTVYNYYHVILRHRTEGEITSQIFETEVPIAYTGEKQHTVNVLFKCYRFLYKPFDEFVYMMDPLASKARVSPKWFMSLVSLYGLGFQLLVMAIFLVTGWIAWIVPFFILYSILIPVSIGVRRIWLG